MSQFRQTGGRLNRSGRTTADHDVFEGLPIRQWRLTEVAIAPPQQNEQMIDKDAWPELPMPRDAHLLPEHSQQLLRAARAGRTSKPATAVQDEDKENEEGDEEQKSVQPGFTVKRFTKLARHLEEPEVEYLAKRRKGLPSVHSALNVVAAPGAAKKPMRKTKVRKTDAEGNTQVWEVLVPEGQTVEGEVLEAESAAVEALPAPLPGTLVEGVGVVNAEGVVVAASETIQVTPQRIRRPPPPKKKKNRGPGRGHKKKVAFTNPDGTIGEGLAGATPQVGLAVPGALPDGNTPIGPSDADTPMGEAQDGEDNDDDDEDGEEGDDDSDREDGEVSESPSRQPTQDPPRSVPAPVDVQMMDAANLQVEPTKEKSPAPASAPIVEISESAPLPETIPQVSEGPVTNLEPPPGPSRDPSSSPELPLATVSHSRSGSMNQIPTVSLAASESIPAQAPTPSPIPSPPAPPASQIDTMIPDLNPTPAPAPAPEPAPAPALAPVPAPPLVPMEPAVAPEPPLEPQKAEIPADVPAAPESIPPETQPPAPSQELPAPVLSRPAVEEPAPAPILPPPVEPIEISDSIAAPPGPPVEPPNEPELKPVAAAEEISTEAAGDVQFSDGEPDLLGSLERHLESQSKKAE